MWEPQDFLMVLGNFRGMQGKYWGEKQGASIVEENLVKSENGVQLTKNCFELVK